MSVALCDCGRSDCAAINEICCKHYANHPTHNKRKLRFEIGDKVCCTKNATVNAEVTDLHKPDVSQTTSVRLCNGEIFFIENVGSTVMSCYIDN